MRTFNHTVLMLGTALLLQACAGGDHVAVANQATPPTFGSTAEEMTGGSVKVYSLDGDAPAPVFGDEAGPGYALRAPDANLPGTDTNVQVFSLDDGPASYDNGIPPMMPPSGGAPYMSPFPPEQASGGVMLRPPPGYTDGGAYEQGVTVSHPSMGGRGAEIHFNHGSSRLTGEGKQVVQSVAQQQMQYNPAGMIEVEGHASTRAEVADPIERRIMNLKISMDRAFKVSSALIRSGVPATAIKTTAYGDTRPAADEAGSRRVNILTAP